MMDWWTKRQFLETEQMDAPDVDRKRLIAALGFIRRVNRWLGYTRATLARMDEIVRDLPADRPLRILDVATGSADVPQAIAAWAKKRGRTVSVVGLDLHESTLDYAHTVLGSSSGCTLVRGDALALPFEDAAFDVVMTSMFTHHLPDDQVVTVLREMRRVASRGVIVADLMRSRRAYRWITFFTLLADPIARHDAPVSVRQAFTRGEMQELAKQAGMPAANITDHFGYRFILAAFVSPLATGLAPVRGGP